MDILIDRLYELRDDLFEPLLSDRVIVPDYNEVYTLKRVIKGIEEDVFILRSKTFYEVLPSHIPANYKHLDVAPSLLVSGVLAMFNKKQKRIYLYNCSNNSIYIHKKFVIGEAYD